MEYVYPMISYSIENHIIRYTYLIQWDMHILYNEM